MFVYTKTVISYSDSDPYKRRRASCSPVDTLASSIGIHFCTFYHLSRKLGCNEKTLAAWKKISNEQRRLDLSRGESDWTYKISNEKSINVWCHFCCVIVEEATANFHPDSICIMIGRLIAHVTLHDLNLMMIEIRVYKRREDQSLIGINFLLVVGSLVRFLAALSSIKISDDECWLIVLHLRRCQTLLASFQISHFGHLNDGDFLGAAHFLLFIGRCGRLAIWRANAFREAFLHDTPLTDPTICIVACFYFKRRREMKGRKIKRLCTRSSSPAQTSTRFAGFLFDSSCQHKYRIVG